MAQIFEGKVRRLGNSMAVIIPNAVLSEAGVHEGDLLKLVITVTIAKRRRLWKKFAGIDEGLPPFSREKKDRGDGW